MDEKVVYRHLVRIEPHLLPILTVDEMLLAILSADEVIDELKRQSLKANEREFLRVTKLLSHVRRDVKRRLNPLLKALRNTQQLKVVEIITQDLKLNQNYEVDFITQSHGQVASIDQALEKCVQLLHEENLYFARNLSVFKDRKGFKSYTVNLSQLFTRLCLMSESSSFIDDNDEISLEEALKKGAKNVLFIGVPGSGKTSLLLQAENEWARARFAGENDQSTAPILKNIKILIYIRPEDCKSTLQKTIDSILDNRCGEHKHAAKKLFEDYPEETAILIDSIDEISGRKRLVDDIFRYMKQQRGVVIAGVRTNHPVLDEIHNVPHIRRVKVEGFMQRDICNYIEKFFQWHNKPDVINEFQEILTQDEQLCCLLMNPLVLCLVCILINEGAFKVEELKGITRINIYTRIEELVLRREGLKRESNKGNLERFHKYCLRMLLQEGNFFIEEMRSFEINPHKLPFVTIKDVDLKDTNKGQEVVWPHRSFIEFGAAKHIADSEDEVRDMLLIYIAGQRHLNNLLNFLLELLPLSMEQFKCVMNVVLALQPEINSSGINWHRLNCCTPDNKKVVQVLENLTVMDLLQESASQCFKYKMHKILPCRKCWLSSKYAWTNEGRAITQNIRLFIHLIYDGDVRRKMLSETLGTLFPDGLGPGGLNLDVPEADRQLNVKEDGVSLIIAANHPSDIKNTKAFGLWGSRKLGAVRVDTGQAGGVFGDLCNIETSEHWKEFLNELIQSTPTLEEEGLLSLRPSAYTTADVIIVALAELYQDLHKHGIRVVRIYGSQLRTVPKMIELVQLGWKIKLGKRALSLIPPKAGIKIRLRILADGLYLGVPGTERRVSILKVGDKTMLIKANNLHDIISTKTFIWTKSKKLGILIISIGWTGSIYGDPYNSETNEGWEDIFKELIKSDTNLVEEGSLNLVESSKTSSTIAVSAFAELDRDLHANGIREVLLHNLETAETLSQLSSQGWTFDLEDQSFSMATPTSEILIKRKLSKEGLVLFVPESEKSIKVINTSSDNTKVFLANHPTDIVVTKAVNVCGKRRLENLQIHTGLTGGKYGTSSVEESIDDWKNLLNEIILFACGIEGEGLLSIGRLANTTADVVLMALIDLYQALGDLGFKEVRLHESHLQTAAIVPELRGRGWQVELRENILLLVPPLADIPINIILVERQLLLAVPGNESTWVSIKATGTSKPMIYSHQPQDIVNSWALTLWGDTGPSGLELFTNEHGDLYGDIPRVASSDEWSQLLGDLVDQGPNLTGDGELVLHHDSSADSQEDGSQKAEFDDLLGVLAGKLPDLYNKGVRNIKLHGGIVRARSILDFIAELGQRWDLRKHWIRESWNVNHEWCCYTRLYSKEVGEKTMSIVLFESLISCSSQTEMERTQSQIKDIRLCDKEVWELIPPTGQSSLH